MQHDQLAQFDEMRGPPPATLQSTGGYEATDVLKLAELVPVIRDRLGLDSAFPDDAVLASLKSIAARSSPLDRWRAALASNLGHWLGLKDSDLNGALSTLLALLPRPPVKG